LKRGLNITDPPNGRAIRHCEGSSPDVEMWWPPEHDKETSKLSDHDKKRSELPDLGSVAPSRTRA
jgi:hypothetical protein